MAWYLRPGRCGQPGWQASREALIGAKCISVLARPSLRCSRLSPALRGWSWRDHDAALLLVIAWAPPGGDRGGRCQPEGYLRRAWQEAAARQLRDALAAAWGQSLMICGWNLMWSGARPAGSWSPSPVTPVTCWWWAPAGAVRWPA